VAASADLATKTAIRPQTSERRFNIFCRLAQSIDRTSAKTLSRLMLIEIEFIEEIKLLSVFVL
jgi:hypothetical protein